MLDNIFRYLDLYLSSFSKFISVFGICSGVLLSFINVILRYIFNMSITWAAELSIYLFMASALLSSSLGFKNNLHIKIDILLHMIPNYLLKPIILLANLISTTYLLLILYYSYKLVIIYQEFGEISIDLNIPMWVPYLILPISFFIATIYILENTFKIYKKDSKSLLKKDEYLLEIRNKK